MLTKPAGVFLQLLGAPCVIYGFFGIFTYTSHAWIKLILFLIGLGLMYLGGIPAIRKEKP